MIKRKTKALLASALIAVVSLTGCQAVGQGVIQPQERG